MRTLTISGVAVRVEGNHMFLSDETEVQWDSRLKALLPVTKQTTTEYNPRGRAVVTHNTTPQSHITHVHNKVNANEVKVEIEKGDIVLNQTIVDKQAKRVTVGTVERIDGKYYDSRGRELKLVTSGVYKVHVPAPVIRKMSSTSQPAPTPKYVGEYREVWDERHESVTLLRVIREGAELIAYEDGNGDTLHSYLCIEHDDTLTIVAGRTRKQHWRKDGTTYQREFTMGKRQLAEII